MTSHSWLILLALGAMSTACGGKHTDTVSPVDAPVTLEAVNNNALPVELFVSSAGASIRLGTVHPGMTAKFTVPPAFVGGRSVEFLANNTGGDGYRSGTFVLAPGEIVDLNIHARMFNSTTVLRP